MPIEIRELIIKTTVNNNSDSPSAGNRSGGNAASNIDEIVEKVFEIIKEKSER